MVHDSPRIDQDRIARALELIKKGRAEYEYFFNSLDNHEWVQPLYKEGYFKYPPQPIANNESIFYPVWVESRCLARLAEKHNADFTDIIAQVEDTDNIRVHEDLALAIKYMPTTSGLLHLDRMLSWLSKRHLFGLPRTLASIATQWASTGHIDQALSLASDIWKVLPDPEESDASLRIELGRYHRLEGQPRFDLWQYEECLKKEWPWLMGCAPVPFFNLICDLLDTAVRYQLSPENRDGPDDLSYIWRPAIEEHEQNSKTGGMHEILVTWVRDSALFIARSGAEQARQVISQLETYSWHVFKRLALHVVRENVHDLLDIACTYLTDDKYFDNHHIRHEYYWLLHSAFPLMDGHSRSRLLGKIDAGPNLDNYNLKENEVDAFVKGWKVRCYQPIREHLDKDHGELASQLIAETGYEPEHPDFYFYTSTGFMGPTSPLSSKDLGEMTVDQVVAFLRQWQSDGKHESPSEEGLGRFLSEHVKGNAGIYSANARRFIGLSPTYIRSLFFGMRECKGDLDWKSIIELGQWVVEQPRSANDPAWDYRSGDSHWGWCRGELANLLENGLSTQSIPSDMETNSRIWAILRVLITDPNPTPEEEAQYGPPNMDLFTYSINTTRGKAFHALMQYLNWCKKHWELISPASGGFAGLDSLPEAKQAVESHLDLACDASLMIRSIYGQYLPLLRQIDPSWVGRQLRTILPTDPTLDSLWCAAFFPLIARWTPGDWLISVLEEDYIRAVRMLADKTTPEVAMKGIDKALITHIATFYLNKRIEMDGSLLTAYLTKANGTQRGEFLHIISSAVGDEEYEKRKREYCKWRFRVANAHPDERELMVEIANVGWLIEYEQNDPEWVLDLMLMAIELAHNIEPSWLVFRKLGAIFERYPVKVLRLVKGYLNYHRGLDEIWMHREQIENLLRDGLKSSDSAIVSLSEDMVNHIVGVGLFEFRRLLDEIKPA